MDVKKLHAAIIGGFLSQNPTVQRLIEEQVEFERAMMHVQMLTNAPQDEIRRVLRENVFDIHDLLYALQIGYERAWAFFRKGEES